MTQRVFFDTNVLIYEFDPRVPKKQRQARALVREAVEAGTAVISNQVIQEFLNTMSTKFFTPLSPRDLRAYMVSKLWPMCQVQPSPSLFATALSIRESTGYGFYDSMIVSAAMFADCPILYTEDLQDKRMISGLEIRNPFL